MYRPLARQAPGPGLLMMLVALAASGVDYVYVAMDVLPEDLPAAVSGLGALGFRGFNVTMPHKEAILPLLDEVDEAARASGAVNTVVVEERELRGANTDGSGFVEACGESGVGFDGAKVLVVGSGGAAIAVAVLGARRQGAAHLQPEPVARREAAGQAAGAVPEGSDLRLRCHRPARGGLGCGCDRQRHLPGDEGRRSPAAAGQLPGHRHGHLCDAVYRLGKETRFIRLARGRGLRTVSGGRILLYQGVQAQRFGTGKEPDVQTMSAALSL